MVPADATARDDGPSTTVRVSLIVFMPFVAFSDDAQSPPSPSPPGRADAAPLTVLNHVWTPARNLVRPPSTRQDLILWDYSDSLIADLTQQLPHRQWYQQLAQDETPRPRAVPGGHWVPQSCTVELWNSGIGHLVSVYRLEHAGESSWDDVRASVVGLDAKRALLDQGNQVLARALGRPFAEAGPTGPMLFGPGRKSNLQWAQHVFAVESAADDAPALDSISAALTDGGAPLECRVDRGRAVVRLGVEACIATTTSATELRDGVVRVIAAQTSVWAAAIEFDRVLMKQLSKVTVRGGRLSTEELERRSIVLLEVFDRVERFRASVGSMGVHLATVDKDVWDRVNEEWRLSAQLQSLEMKLNAVEHVHQHLTATLATRQARVLNQVVLLITLLSLASFLLATWDFTHKHLDSLGLGNVVVVALSLLAALALFFTLRYRMGRTTVGLIGSRRLRQSIRRR